MYEFNYVETNTKLSKNLLIKGYLYEPLKLIRGCI